METQLGYLNRNEKILAVMTLTVVGFFFVMFLLINKSSVNTSQIESHQINYQMARPEENYSEYSLNGRDIDRTYEALQKKAQAIKASALAKKAKASATQAAAQKKLAETTAKNQAQAKAFAEKQKSLPLLKSQNFAKAGEAQKPETQSNDSQEARATAQAAVTPATNPNPQANEAKAKDKKTFAEWRSSIFSQPTREQLNLFIEAYRKNEVTSAEFQAMAQDLVDQNDEKLKGLGLYALRAVPSLASFSQLVHVQSEVSDSYKSYIEQAYLAYMQPQNIGYLNQALLTKDKALILKSLNLLGANLQKIAKGDVSVLVEPRSRRDASAPSSTGVAISNFRPLIPALTSLGSSQDQELAPLAQQVMSYIQSTNNVALN